MATKKTEPRLDFRGGISRHRRQNANELFYLKNLIPRPDGSLVVRPGYIVNQNNGATGRIIKTFGRYTQTNKLHIYSVKTESGVPNDVIYDNDALLTGPDFGNSVYCGVDHHKSAIFFGNGVGTLQYHIPGTSTRAIIEGDPLLPNGKYLGIYKLKLFVLSTDGFLYWSNENVFLELPTVLYHANNNRQIGTADNPGTGLAIAADFLVAFTPDYIGLMKGAPGDNGSFGDMFWRFFYGIGCTASSSITVSPFGEVVFLDTGRRLRKLAGTIPVDLDPEDKVREYLTAPPVGIEDAINCKFVGDDLWVYLPKTSSRANGHILILTNKGTWHIYEDIAGYAFTSVPGFKDSLYVGSVIGSRILELNTGDEDEGSKIAVEAIFKKEYMGTMRKKKSWDKVYFLVDINQGDELTFEYALDNSPTFIECSVGSPDGPDGIAWGANTWDEEDKWQYPGVRSIELFFNDDGTPVHSYEIQLRVSGNLSSNSRILFYELEGSIDQKDGDFV